jgi:type VII secretion integral membrane protein EccD
MHPTDAGLRRVVVYADSGHVDLALPATLPVGSLIPPIVDLLDAQVGHRVEPAAIAHQLSLPGDIALDPAKTLAQLMIRDGSTLILTSSSTVLMPPRFDDPAEAVSVSLAATTRPWTRRTAQLIGVLMASPLASTSAAILIGTACDNNDLRRGGAAIAGAAALVALLAAVVSYRVLSDVAAGLTLGLMACGFAAVAGLLAVPGGLGAPQALLATAATTTSAAIMRTTGCCVTAFTALACFASIGSAAAAVGAVTAAPLPVIGAASAAISLMLIEASAPASMVLTRLSSRVVPETTAHDLGARAIRANGWLTSLVAAFCAAAALGAVGAAAGALPAQSPPRLGIAFAALTGALLLLRARAHPDLARSVPLLVAGTATLSGTLVVAVVAYPQHVLYLAVASTALAAAALCLGFLTQSMTFSPVWRRSIELVEYVALAAVVPLACWICGLYGAAGGLNL